MRVAEVKRPRIIMNSDDGSSPPHLKPSSAYHPTLEQWLKDAKLPSLLPKFHDAYYTDMDIIAEYGLEDDDFAHLDISLPIHKRALRKAVKLLQVGKQC